MRRAHRSAEGFSLIELMVVMIVIGVLSAIAVPVINAQRGKANDAATRQDTIRLGKSVTAYFLAATTPPVVRVLSGRLDVSGEDVGAVSGGVVVAGGNPAVVDVSGWTTTAWCLALTNPSGDLQTFKFSAQNGLQSGTCSSPTAP